MSEIFRIFFFHTVLLLYCDVYGEEASKSVIDIWAPELYSLYKEAFITDKKYLTRRMYKDNRQFMLHVQKLKEVNGFKTHNLKVEQKSLLRESSPIIYINNPVEAQQPNSFLTVEQFKNAMVDQIEKQRSEFKIYKNIHPIKKIIKPSKHSAKVNIGNLGNPIFISHVTPKKQSSTGKPTKYVEKHETPIASKSVTTELINNITTYQKLNVVTEVTTEATTLVKSEEITTTLATTESTFETTTQTKEQTEYETETTFNTETDAPVEETTDETHHEEEEETTTETEGHEEVTTEHVKSSVRTRLPRPYVFLGGQNY